MKADKLLTVDDLSSDQLDVYEGIVDWTSRRAAGTLTVGGYAGTGKSSILGVFAASTDLRIAYVSFTGRASSVLKRKLKACGVVTTNLLQASDNASPIAGYSYSSLDDEASLPFCGTIHRLLYKPIVDSKTEEIIGWRKREHLDRGYDVLVVDEASMVSDELLDDLQVHGTPILAVGDHGQLPPVASSGLLMKNPDLRLEKIHRQAEGSPIIRLAHMIRVGEKMKPLEGVTFADKGDLSSTLRVAYAATAPMDVGVLCWMNKTRVKLNMEVRKARGMTGAPRKGEVVICLRNRPPIYNGMRGLLTEDTVVRGAPWHLYARVEFPDEGVPEAGYTLCAPQFNRERTYGSVEELQARGVNVEAMGAAGEFFDFGFCLTAHKSQGGQFGHAIVYLDRQEKPWDEDWRRWMYTCVTRASERLTIIR